MPTVTITGVQFLDDDALGSGRCASESTSYRPGPIAGSVEMPSTSSG